MSTSVDNMREYRANRKSLSIAGLRQIVTGLAELKRKDQKLLCTSMCIGSGMGAAGIFVNESSRSVPDAIH